MSGIPSPPLSSHQVSESSPAPQKTPSVSTDGNVQQLDGVTPKLLGQQQKTPEPIKLNTRKIRAVPPGVTTDASTRTPALSKPAFPLTALVSRATAEFLHSKLPQIVDAPDRKQALTDLRQTYAPANTKPGGKELIELNFLLQQSRDAIGTDSGFSADDDLLLLQIEIQVQLDIYSDTLLNGKLPPEPEIIMQAEPSVTDKAPEVVVYENEPRLYGAQPRASASPFPETRDTDHASENPAPASTTESDRDIAAEIARRVALRKARTNNKKFRPLRPHCHKTLLKAISSRRKPDQSKVRQQMVKGYADYYFQTLSKKGLKETQEEYTVRLINTIQQASGNKSPDDLKAFRANLQRDISDDVGAATQAAGKKVATGAHPFETWKKITGVTINRQMETSLSVDAKNPAGSGAEMASFRMVDTKEIDEFAIAVQERQRTAFLKILKKQLRLLPDMKTKRGKEQAWQSLKSILEPALRKDMEASIQASIETARSEEKKNAHRTKMAQRLTARLDDCRTIFMEAIKT